MKEGGLYMRYGGEYLTPGKDHRGKPGKATFKGKGAAQRCASIAYWGKPIHRALTLEEWAGVTLVTRICHALGSRMFPERYALIHNIGKVYTRDTNPDNISIFAPAVYRPYAGS